MALPNHDMKVKRLKEFSDFGQLAKPDQYFAEVTGSKPLKDVILIL